MLLSILRKVQLVQANTQDSLPRTHDISLMFKNAGIPFLVSESLLEQRVEKLYGIFPLMGCPSLQGVSTLP